MKTSKRAVGTGSLLVLSALTCATAHAAPSAKGVVKKAVKAVATNAAMMALPIKLPKPMFVGTKKNPPAWSTALATDTTTHRPPFMVPKGVTLLSVGKVVTSSDDRPIIGSLSNVTDGEKGADDGNWVELAPGKQWVQIDLQQPYSIYAIVIWHYHGEPRIYKDVVVQVADDADITKNVRALFNNDEKNESGLGVGKDRQYFETADGKLVPGKGVKARYVRLYSNGNSSDDQNRYTEVEVWGK